MRNSPSVHLERLDHRAAGDRVEDSRVPSAGVRSSPPATQKIVEVGASSTIPSGRTSSASSAPPPLAIRVACMLAP